MFKGLAALNQIASMYKILRSHGAEGRGQRTEDRGQRTEDRGQIIIPITLTTIFLKRIMLELLCDRSFLYLSCLSNIEQLLSSVSKASASVF
ncbi:hypothetical protein BES34_020165 [Leptospira inadai serovar Lyme]|uniref:Uncharacterized protein n=1 Tax=Leptospira inadai serovar Lyme TaxID=293084 RepID=A0ABX4YD30_9LEPT|nr:hypothetical protein BES34_020165 [Leptospira inadai serovar Lyme]